MAYAAAIKNARTVVVNCEEAIDEIIGGDVEFVHGEILSRGLRQIISCSVRFRVRCSEQTASQPLS